KIQDVLSFEERLREEENFWGWEINEAYIQAVKKSFDDSAFENSISLLAYDKNIVIGRIDSTIIASHFDGSKKAYLDWICVIKSYRHHGVAQKMLEALRKQLKENNIDTLIALTASNEEAQNFYKNIPNSFMRDIGIWIDIK
ncbi:MAG: GNAT family N-acetyltransferase, partial [Anaeroplasmataceae bacterium]|nr:GNAT family N-acetyltransferase [Anaeroplasmataceae bacterium]